MSYAGDSDSNNDELIRKTSVDFSTLFKISSDTNVKCIDDNIEGVLSRLDELYGMLDMIRNDNAVITNELLCDVRDQMKKLKPIFQKIDKMEQFVQSVKGNVSVLEKEVKVVEDDFSAVTSIRKAISGLKFLPGKKKADARYSSSNKAPYVPPKIFSSSEWLHPYQDHEVAQEAVADADQDDANAPEE